MGGMRRVLLEIFEEGDNVKIPAIKEYRSFQRNMPIKTGGKIQGRPIVVLKRLIDFGFERKYWNRELIGKLIEYGFDKGYWVDVDVLKSPVMYFLKDRNWKKKEMAEGGNNGRKPG